MEADLADLVKLDPHSTTKTVTNTLDYASVASHCSDCNYSNFVLLYMYTRQCCYGVALRKNHASQPLTRFQLFHHQRPFHQPHHPWTRMVLRPVILDQTSLCMQYMTIEELTKHAERIRVYASRSAVSRGETSLQ